MPVKLLPQQRLAPKPSPRLRQKMQFLALSQRDLWKELVALKNASSAFTFSTDFNESTFDLASEHSALEELESEFFLDHNLSPDKKLAAQILFNSLNPNGFLESSLSSIAAATHISETTIEKLRQEIKNYQNSGLACENLSEWIAFQLRKKESLQSLHCRTKILKILDQLRPILDWRTLVKRIQNHFSPEDFREFWEAVSQKKISWSPIVPESSTPTGMVDLELFPSPNGYGLRIPQRPNSGNIKALPDLTKSQQQWVQSLQNLLAWRQQILLKIGHAIFDHHSDFVRTGEPSLHLLTQQELAQKLELSPSTISRCVKEKTVKTPFGYYPLSTFLAKTRRNSTINVELLLKKMARELPESLFWSDEELRQYLKKHFNLEITRRNLCRYRHRIFS